MCEMASWFKTKEGILFLTDEDVIAAHGGDKSGINWNDYVGHDGLMKVFNLPNNWYHNEGFIGMPEVIKGHIFAGKMDMLFAHADNLREAPPEFYPVLQRLQRFKHVREAMERNPFHKGGLIKKFKNLTRQGMLHKMMDVGIKKSFTGSTIGNILRDHGCSEDTMLLALNSRKTRDYMNGYGDHHHYHNIIKNPYTTKRVLQYLATKVRHSDVKRAAVARLDALKTMESNKANGKKPWAPKKIKVASKKFRSGGSRAVVRTLA